VDGVELEANYDSGFIFAGLSYTYTHTDLATQVNGFGAQSYLPDHLLTLTGGFRLLQEKLTVGARGTFASEAYNGADQPAASYVFMGQTFYTNGDPNNPFTDGYALLDLYTNYKLDNGLELGANLTNVFDVAYTPALTTPVTNFTGDTGRGRTVLFTARAQF
jgi:hemoglobin/transferrin/lactoferrin receptor protein